MKRLYFLSAMMIVALSSTITLAEVNHNGYIQKAQDWFSNLKTAQSRFDQIDHHGNVLTGTFSINRPGRLRFEYDDPIKDYIVADGFQIHFYDSDSGQATSGPIGATLADFILRDDVDFDDDIQVKSVRERDDQVLITVTQADESGIGELILHFEKEPFALKSWQIIDAQGLTTNIVLHDLKRDIKLSPTLFRMDNLNLNE